MLSECLLVVAEDRKVHAIDIVRKSTAHSITQTQRGCSVIKSKANDVMPKRLYVTQMFTTEWWSCRLDLDLDAVHFMSDVPLLCGAQ